MDPQPSQGPFPAGFPLELVSAAFVAGDEAAWRPSEAARSVDWLGAHGYAVLGTEIWLPQGRAIQSVPYFQNVERNGGEQWDLFVARATAETLAYLRAFASKFAEEGDIFVNVTWVDKADFNRFCSPT